MWNWLPRMVRRLLSKNCLLNRPQLRTQIQKYPKRKKVLIPEETTTVAPATNSRPVKPATSTQLEGLSPSVVARVELARMLAPNPGETEEEAKARYFSSLPCIKRQRDLYRLNPLLPRDPETLEMFREGTKNNCPAPESDFYGFGRTGEDVDREILEDATRAEQCKPPWEKYARVSTVERNIELIKFFRPQPGETLEQAKTRVFPTLPIIRSRRDMYRLNPKLPRDPETLRMFTEKTASNIENSINNFYPAGQTVLDKRCGPGNRSGRG